jgi:hypothetical protein
VYKGVSFKKLTRPIQNTFNAQSTEKEECELFRVEGEGVLVSLIDKRSSIKELFLIPFANLSAVHFEDKEPATIKIVKGK